MSKGKAYGEVTELMNSITNSLATIIVSGKDAVYNTAIGLLKDIDDVLKNYLNERYSIPSAIDSRASYISAFKLFILICRDSLSSRYFNEKSIRDASNLIVEYSEAHMDDDLLESLTTLSIRLEDLAIVATEDENIGLQQEAKSYESILRKLLYKSTK